jgi:hypothetical protein|tara:strand:- start:94 stop:213 length:120 start_codon:yes stop_codon:yes gene_type:complete
MAGLNASDAGWVAVDLQRQVILASAVDALSRQPLTVSLA